MKKIFFYIMLLSILLFCNACSENTLYESEGVVASDTSAEENNSDDIEADLTTEENLSIPYYSYSEDDDANELISYYNYFFEEDITKDMVEYKRLAVDNTTISFDDVSLLVSECDGSASYICTYEAEYSPENNEKYFEIVKKLIKSTYPTLPEETIQSDLINVFMENSESSKIVSGYYIEGVKYCFSYEREDGMYSTRWYYQAW